MNKKKLFFNTLGTIAGGSLVGLSTVSLAKELTKKGGNNISPEAYGAAAVKPPVATKTPAAALKGPAPTWLGDGIVGNQSLSWNNYQGANKRTNTDMVQDLDGNIWIWTPVGMFSLKRGATKWVRSANFYSPGGWSPSAQGGVAKLFLDSLGNIYAARTGFGHVKVLKRGGTSWKDLGFNVPGISEWDRPSIVEDFDGNVYMKIRGLPLKKHLPNTPLQNWVSVKSNIVGATRQFVADIPDNGGKLFVDSLGNVWSSSNDELLVLPKGKTTWEVRAAAKFTRKKYYGSIGYGSAGKFAEDKAGNIWFKDMGHILQVLRKGSVSFQDVGNGYVGKDFSFVYLNPDSNGNIWVTTEGASAQVLRQGHTKWEQVPTFTNGSDESFLEDSNGNLWMSTDAAQGGFNVLKKGTTKWQVVPGISGQGKIIEDADGNIWMVGYDEKLKKPNVFFKRKGSNDFVSPEMNINDENAQINSKILITREFGKKGHINSIEDTASAIASRVTDAITLKDELGFDLTGITGSTLTITAIGKSVGTIRVYVAISNKYATQKTIILTHLIHRLPDDQIVANALQKSNLAKLKAALAGTVTIKAPLEKATVIASRITDKITLKDELGIDLTEIIGSTFAITATGAPDGTITISAKMTTMSATTPVSNVTPLVIHQTPDKILDVNILQRINVEKLNKALAIKPTIKVITDKASDIASRITDIVSLKRELGIDLTSIGGSTFAIVAKGIPNGTITVSVKMKTVNALTSAPTTVTKTKDYSQLSDAELKIFKKNISIFKKYSSNAQFKKELAIKDKTAQEISNEINSASTDSIKNILKENLGMTLPNLLGAGKYKVSSQVIGDGKLSIHVSVEHGEIHSKAEHFAALTYNNDEVAQYIEDHKSKGLGAGGIIGFIFLAIFSVIGIVPCVIYLHKRWTKAPSTYDNKKS